MNNRLYREFAPYYAAASGDRDFKNQLASILSTYTPESPCNSFLELFAGQAVHSLEAQENQDLDVWALDSSREMKQLAIKNGFKNPNQYILGNLPESILKLSEKTKFDCITCLYNGLSNLTTREVYELLSNSQQLLNTHGKIFIEMHDVAYIMEYITDPQIHFTETQTTEGESFKYAWPSGKIKWDNYSYTAKVPVQFLIPTSKRTDTIEFTSIERIYSVDEVRFMAGLLDYNCRILTEDPLWQINFAGEIILELSLK
ncbi:hypothetical protein [Pedobacter cryoconitis]|uniref:16S rRNA G966 N2-methylase RsmD n=1 Tax=Pedobacter cryoconitis TaxID=188932 RepID=A0A7X0MKT0_9SPHI|nr:hypothetical protein [Pedobacter cryoconitis]MBB6501035.1 16S rRNA G966 N2-methylase RsmD [Pedobacter cryoconitis]